MPESTAALERILTAARSEFLENGYLSASLRSIVRSAGLTTGAFYGYFSSKAELFSALVEPHYTYVLTRFLRAQAEFAALPHERQPENLSTISGDAMLEILHYAYDHPDEFRLLLCCADGTRFAGMIDEMVEAEIDATHAYQAVLAELGHPSPDIDSNLEHILVTGMFNAYFELIIHRMPLADAENYLTCVREFYTAGWMKIMRQ